MLTKEQVLEAIKSDRTSNTIDGRDYQRLCRFFPVKEWGYFNCKLADGAEPPEPIPWTEEEILNRLRDDIAFGFEKALNQRGISSSTMYAVVKMWMWVLGETRLAEWNDYAMYGLPLFKAVALKFGFHNPIGDDTGTESKYDLYG